MAKSMPVINQTSCFRLNCRQTILPIPSLCFSEYEHHSSLLSKNADTEELYSQVEGCINAMAICELLKTRGFRAKIDSKFWSQL